MERRSERHTDTLNNEIKISRTRKNQYLYDDINTKIGYEDLVSLDTQTRIDLSNLTGINTNREDYQKTKDVKETIIRNETIKEEIMEPLTEEKKVFDINDVLEEARRNRTETDELERKRKLRNSEYFDSNETNIEIENKSTKKNLDEDALQGIIDEINTKDLSKELSTVGTGLFDELISTSTNVDMSIDGIAEEAIEEETDEEETEEEKKEKKKIVNSFYTRSMELSRRDFSEEEEEYEGKKTKTKVMIVITILLLIGIVVAGYLFCKKQGMI